MSRNHTGLKNGGPTALSATSSSPADRNVSTVAGPVVPAASAYAAGRPSAMATRWAKFFFRIDQRTPTHASSSTTSASAMQIAPSRST